MYFSYLLIFLLMTLLRSHSVFAPAAGLALTTKQDPLQQVVTWDEHSILVHGERIMILSGEFHPFRLPSPGLWLDVFQKIKALGFSAVSFYVDWALVEGEPGYFRADGIFCLEQFFEAASQVGLYLLARPGPYINAETSGGGFPGWLQRNKGKLRTSAPDYVAATESYLTNILAIIAKAQITNGGPIIAVQVENEYSISIQPDSEFFLTLFDVANSTINQTARAILDAHLSPAYMANLHGQYRHSGIIVPLFVNDALPAGNWAPGSGAGATDLYEFDCYPFPLDAAVVSTSDWPSTGIETVQLEVIPELFQSESPGTPFAIAEFQGGTHGNWGGSGFDKSAALINQEFERVIYKYLYSMGVKILNIYMTYGGTNWGNIGGSSTYTSYDYGAAISEDRGVSREKYSELKLQGHFLKASPSYLLSTVQDTASNQRSTDPAITVSLLRGEGTNFYTVRHRDYTNTSRTEYRLNISTSIGNIMIPQLGGKLLLNGRDSKIHVSDYDVGGINLIYSTAEVFTWAKAGHKITLIVYGGFDELHEIAFPLSVGPVRLLEGRGLNFKDTSKGFVLQWQVGDVRSMVDFGGRLDVYLVPRNEVYNYWVLDTSMRDSQSTDKASDRCPATILKAGYLMRTAAIQNHSLLLTGDINCTTEIEIIHRPATFSSVSLNGKLLTARSDQHPITATVEYESPDLNLPNMQSLAWKYIDSLPEIRQYDDSMWTACNLAVTNNPRNLTTPTSLYASDYGYHTGSLVYRGHFLATGKETSFNVLTQGGVAYAHSVWLNSSYLGSFSGRFDVSNYSQSFQLDSLTACASYVFTILLDHMGLEGDFVVSSDTMKIPRGILDFELSFHSKLDLKWRMTGNLGGERYRDKSRGPLNEGSMYVERLGLHLPGAPTLAWKDRSPYQGLEKPGVGFFSTTLDLSIPVGYDVPLYFVFPSTSNATGAHYRCQLYVNGFQFGKYVHNIGPQSTFYVPEGVLNHNGSNYVGLILWAQDEGGAKLDQLELKASAVVQSGYQKPSLVRATSYSPRVGAY